MTNRNDCSIILKERLFGTYVQIQEAIKMTGSNAKILASEEKKITVTVRRKKNQLVLQKLAGAAMLILIGTAMSAGEEASAAAILAPMAFAALFSKEKLMDFGAFYRKK